MKTISKKELEKHRDHWKKIAQKNGWFRVPFYIQVWINRSGRIVDSITHKELHSDLVFNQCNQFLYAEIHYTIK